MTEQSLTFTGERISGVYAVSQIEAAITRMQAHPQSERRDAVIGKLQRKLEAARRGETFIVRDVTEDWIGAVGGEIAKLTRRTRLAHNVPKGRES